MSKVKIQGNASGTGVVTLTAPNTNTDRTITLPDGTQTLIGTNASGNVGIGTSSPSQPLHIKGGAVRFEDASSVNDTYLQMNSLDTHLYTAGSKDLRLGTAATERMRINSAGNVGIGTTDADSKLKVELKPSGPVLAGLRVGYNGTSVNYLDGDTNIFRNGLGNAERMRINSAGIVTTPYQPAFDVYHNSGSYSSGTTATSLDLNSTRLNNGNHYNTSTDRFVAPVAGIYQFNYRVIVNGTVSNAHIRIQKNGSTMQGTDSHYSSGSGSGVWGQFQEQIVVSLSANDYVQVYHLADTSIYGNSYQSFNGHLIG